MGEEALFELVFMMVILKIPVLYLCAVVYWAVRAEPRPLEPALRTAVLPSPHDAPPDRVRPGRRGRSAPPQPRQPRPHGRPERAYARRTPTLRARGD